MFNYHTNQRKIEIAERNEKMKIKQAKINLKRGASNEEFVKNYIERTTHSLQGSNEGEERLIKYRDPKYEPRSFNKKLNIGPPSFYYRHRSIIERINESVKAHENLDSIPFYGRYNPSQHQFRNLGEERCMKFTAYTSASRVAQTLKDMKTNEIPSSWDINLSKTNRLRIEESNKSLSKIPSKSFHILPYLNKKSHPKSLESIHNKLNIGVLKKSPVADSRNKLFLQIALKQGLYEAEKQNAQEEGKMTSNAKGILALKSKERTEVKMKKKTKTQNVCFSNCP